MRAICLRMRRGWLDIRIVGMASISLAFGMATLAQITPVAAAQDGMRLCAKRWGKCTCQAPGDTPGHWTFMDDSRCTNAAAGASAIAPGSASAPVEAAKAATDAASKPVPAKALPVNAAPAIAPPIKAAAAIEPPRPAAIAAPITKAPVTKAATSAAAASVPAAQWKAPAKGFSDCAVRNGLCTCKGPEDGEGQWSLVDGSRCKVMLLSNLSSAPASPLPVKKETTQDVQRMLTRLGYDPGSTGGQIDKRTDAAIRSFQESAGLPVDGKITDLLVSRLKGMQPDISATPTPRMTSAGVTSVAAQPASAANSISARASSANASPASAKPAVANAASASPAGASQTSASATSASANAPVTNTASGGDGMRLCAMRKGVCLCRAPDDLPGTWTTMAASRCTPTR